MPDASVQLHNAQAGGTQIGKRLGAPSLEAATPMIAALPAIYQEDDFTTRWLAGLDAVLAPIASTIDCFDAYLDTSTTPDDMLAWIGSWVGVSIDDEWSRERRQQLVAEAVDLYGRRGTVAGFQRFISLIAGAPVEVVEGGGAVASMQPGAELPGTDAPAFIVRVQCAPPTDVVQGTIAAAIAQQRPAHLPCVIEYTGPTGATP
jgi:phage tail-like protein